MTHRKFQVRFIMLALGLCSAFASAVPVSFLAWDGEVSSRKVAVAWGNESIKIVNMHPLQRTDKVDIPAGAERLRIVARDRKDEKGKSLSIPLTLETGIKNPLVLLLPDDEEPAGLRLIVLEDDVDKFRWGTIHLINATEEELIFIHEEKEMNIEAGWSPVVVAPGGESRKIGVAFYLPDKRDRPIYSGVWQHRVELRQLAFMVPGENEDGSVSFKFITENRVVVEARDAE